MTDLAGIPRSFAAPGPREHLALAHVARPVRPRGALISRCINEFVGRDAEEERWVSNEKTGSDPRVRPHGVCPGGERAQRP